MNPKKGVSAKLEQAVERESPGKEKPMRVVGARDSLNNCFCFKDQGRVKTLELGSRWFPDSFNGGSVSNPGNVDEHARLRVGVNFEETTRGDGLCDKH